MAVADLLMYAPRSYQREFLQAMAGGRKRAVLVWHRRAGKDMTVLNWTAHAMTQRPGQYFYFLPTYTQAKKIVWDGIDGSGKPFLSNVLDHLGPEARPYIQRHDTELKLTFPALKGHATGSVFQLIGGDNIDNVVGTNPVGVVFSEYALMNPRAWDLVRPILAENGGWAVFDYTPRGRNWGHKLYVDAKKDPEHWFVSLKTVADTRRDAPSENGEPVVTAEQVEAERASGMSEELIQQEFYCSFEGAMEGAYYADLIQRARGDGRIGKVPYDPLLPVDTAWDVGMDDQTAIVFTQTDGGLCRVIDYLEDSGHGLDWYAQELRQRMYFYGDHIGPHDLKVRDFSTGNARAQHASKLGIHFRVMPRLPVEDGIQAARRLLAVSIFDAEKCARLIDCLSSYRREMDEKTMTWKPTPIHDWSSHGADAWRIRALDWHGNLGAGASQRAFADTNYHLFGDRGQDVSEQTDYRRIEPKRLPWRPVRSRLVDVEHGSPFDLGDY